MLPVKPAQQRLCPYLKAPDMEILFLLIPLSVMLVVFIAAVFLWAVKAGQFEDMEGPAHQILMDDDNPPAKNH